MLPQSVHVAGWVAKRVGMDASDNGKSLAQAEVRNSDLPDRILITTLTELFRLPTRNIRFNMINMVRVSSVGITTHYGVNGDGVESRWRRGEIFRNCPDRPLGYIQPPVQWVLGLSRG